MAAALGVGAVGAVGVVAGLRKLRERRTKAAENTQALRYDDVRVTIERTRAKNLQTWALNREQRETVRKAYLTTQPELELATKAEISTVKNNLEGLDPCGANEQNLTPIRSAIAAILSNNLVSSRLMTPNETTDTIFNDLGYVRELLAVFETFVARTGSENSTVAVAPAQGVTDVTREKVLQVKIYTDEKRILVDRAEVDKVTTLRTYVNDMIKNLERVSRGGCGDSSVLRNVFKNLASAKNTLEPRGDRDTLTWYKKVEDDTREEIRADDERCRAVIEEVKTFVEDKKYPADNGDTLKLCNLSRDQEGKLKLTEAQRKVQTLKSMCKSLSPAYDNEILFWTTFFENLNTLKGHFRVEVGRNAPFEDILEQIRLITSRIHSVDFEYNGNPTTPDAKIERLILIKVGVETLKDKLTKILCKDDTMKRALLDLTRLDLFVNERKKEFDDFDKVSKKVEDTFGRKKKK